MIPSLRQPFNQLFSEEKHKSFQAHLKNAFGIAPAFRLLETPVFLPLALKKQLRRATQSIVQQLKATSFRQEAHHAIPKGWNVPHEDKHPLFLQFDFAITVNQDQQLTPQLIELQGFPALFFFQHAALQAYQATYSLDGLAAYYDGMDGAQYLRVLREAIVGSHDPKECVLLEYNPWQQRTAIDFAGAQHLLGIPVVDIQTIIREKDRLYYRNEQGQKVPIKRIFNRVILDELFKKTSDLDFDLRQEVQVEWAGHPNWFLKYSKFALPYIKGDFAPAASFLNHWNGNDEELSNKVLKPVYSFSGNGVITNPTRQIIDAIPNKQQYILQDKVTYAPILSNPVQPSQVEVRVMLTQKKKNGEYQWMTNLVRAGRNNTINTQYLKDESWIGGGIAIFEHEKSTKRSQKNVLLNRLNGF